MFDVVLSIIGFLILAMVFVAMFGYLRMLMTILENRTIDNETSDSEDVEDWKLHSYPTGEKEIIITDNQKTDK